MKKLLTIALAVTMSLAGVFSAAAATSATFTGAVFAENTGREELKGDFDVTYTFDIKAPEATENYHSFIVEIKGTDGTNNGYLDLRADAFGWWAATAPDDMWNAAGDLVFTSDFTYAGAQDANWLAVVKDAKATVNVKRVGETVTATYKIVGANGTTVNTSIPVTNSKGFGETVSITLTAEKASLSNVVFTNGAAAATTAAATETSAVTETTTVKETEKATTVKATTKATTTKAEDKEEEDSMSPIVIVVIAVVAIAVVGGIVVATKKKNK